MLVTVPNLLLSIRNVQAQDGLLRLLTPYNARDGRHYLVHLDGKISIRLLY